MKAKIEVCLKNGILDPQAKTIAHGLDSLGFSFVKNVKITKSFILDLDINDAILAEKKAREMSEMLLANPVIEDFKIEIL